MKDPLGYPWSVLKIAHLCDYETATIFAKIFPGGKNQKAIWGNQNRTVERIKSFEGKTNVVCSYGPKKKPSFAMATIGGIRGSICWQLVDVTWQDKRWSKITEAIDWSRVGVPENRGRSCKRKWGLRYK